MSGILDISGLLNTIYGGSSTTATSTPSEALLNLKLAEANTTTDIAQTAKEPEVARDIATFRKVVAAATSPQQLLQDQTVLKVLLTANGLGDQVGYTALAQKALLSDTTDSSSLADQLTDTSWKAAASTFNFAGKGLTIIQNSSVIDTVANGYAEVLWRQSLDTTTPGLSNALTFRADASSITSVDQILADSTLRTVVLTALGIPAQIAYQDIGAEETAISSRLDITQFQNPSFVEKFAQQYLIQNNLSANGSSSASATTALSAYGFASSTTASATASDTLASLVVQSKGLIV